MIEYGVKRSIHNPAVPLSGSAILEYLGGNGTSKSGAVVTPQTAMTYAPVWQAVQQISGDIAKLPLNLYQTVNGVRSVMSSHPSHKIVRRPNEQQNWNKFWRRVMVHALIWNRAYIWIDKDQNGNPRGLYHLLPDRTTWIPDRNIYVTEIDGDARGLFRSEVIEIESIQYDNTNECELVVKFRDSIGLGLAAQGFNSRFFGNGGQPGGILELPAHFTKTAADNLEIGWRKKYDDPQAHFRTAILRDGAKFHQITVDAERSQMHEMREDQVYEVARWYNLPPSRLGLKDATSYNSKAEDNQNYLDMTLSPWMTATKAECDFKLLTEKEQETLGFAHDTGPLLALNPRLRAEKQKIDIEMGKRNPNECREEDGLPPRPGGDEYRLPSGVILESKLSEPEPSEDDRNVNPEVFAAMLDMLNEQACVSMRIVINRVKKEATRKDPQRFCTWYDEEKATWPQLISERTKKMISAIKVSTGQEVGEKLIESTVARFQSQIDTILDTHSEDIVANAIAESCDLAADRSYLEDLRNENSQSSD